MCYSTREGEQNPVQLWVHHAAAPPALERSASRLPPTPHRLRWPSDARPSCEAPKQPAHAGGSSHGIAPTSRDSKTKVKTRHLVVFARSLYALEEHSNWKKRWSWPSPLSHSVGPFPQPGNSPERGSTWAIRKGGFVMRRAGHGIRSVPANPKRDRCPLARAPAGGRGPPAGRERGEGQIQRFSATKGLSVRSTNNGLFMTKTLGFHNKRYQTLPGA